jgi:hypothetical protein
MQDAKLVTGLHRYLIRIFVLKIELNGFLDIPEEAGIAGSS